MMVEHIKTAVATSLERHAIAPVVTLHFDGACEPRNPGGVATGGWIIQREDRNLVVRGCAEFARGPKATNNFAEWCALGCGLRAMLDRIDDFAGCVLKIYGDSQLVINQLNRDWACNKEHLQKLRQRCDAILQELRLPAWIAEWIPREQNEAADALSREAYEKSTGKKFPERVRR